MVQEESRRDKVEERGGFGAVHQSLHTNTVVAGQGCKANISALGKEAESSG